MTFFGLYKANFPKNPLPNYFLFFALYKATSYFLKYAFLFSSGNLSIAYLSIVRGIIL